MKTVKNAVQDILLERKESLAEASYASEQRDYCQLLKMADSMGISIPCQKLFDAFAADDHGSRSRRLKHTMVLKRLDREAGCHAVRPDFRPYNPVPLPSVEETDFILGRVSFPLEQKVDLGYLIVRARNDLEGMGHKPMGIDNDYMDSMNTIHVFFLNNGHEEYDESCMDAFLLRNEMLYKGSHICRGRWYCDRKAGHILNSVAATGYYSWERISSGKSGFADTTLETIHQQFIKELYAKNLRNETIRNLNDAFFNVIEYADISSAEDLKAFSAGQVRKITEEVSQHNSSQSLHAKYSRIRCVFRFLFENGFTQYNAENSLLKPAVVRNNVAGYLSDEDEAKIYCQLGNIPSRDKAIFLLAFELGLRDYDISHLRLDQVDWHNDKIHIVQHKNSKSAVFPLSADIGNALMEYILNDRPKIENPYVFLTSVAPYRRLGHVYVPCRKLLDACGIMPIQGAHRGSHLLRENLTHRMLKKKIPHQVITETLGHSTADSDKAYISMEPEMLRQCALGLNVIGACSWEGGMDNE